MSGGTWSWAGATPLGIADDAEPDNNAAIATDAAPAMTVLGTLTGAGAETSNTSAAIDDANAEAPAPTLVTTAGSGLAFNLIWDPSVSSAPSGFTTDVIAAASYLESQLSNPVNRPGAAR